MLEVLVCTGIDSRKGFYQGYDSSSDSDSSKNGIRTSLETAAACREISRRHRIKTQAGGDWRSDLVVRRSEADDLVVVAEEVRVSQDSAASDRDSGVGEQDMDNGAKANAEDDKAADDKVGGSFL